MTILNAKLTVIPHVSIETIQELGDKYVGSAITRSLVQSIDCDIEHRRGLLEYGYCSNEEVSKINNEIEYLIKLAISLY